MALSLRDELLAKNFYENETVKEVIQKVEKWCLSQLGSFMGLEFTQDEWESKQVCLEYRYGGTFIMLRIIRQNTRVDVAMSNMEPGVVHVEVLSEEASGTSYGFTLPLRRLGFFESPFEAENWLRDNQFFYTCPWFNFMNRVEEF